MAYKNGKMQPDKTKAGRKPSRTLGPNGSFQAGDRKHQRLAIGGATRAFNAGHIGKTTELNIQRQARALLNKGKSGRAGRTSRAGRTLRNARTTRKGKRNG